MARLGFILLNQVNTVNSFLEVTELFLNSAETSTIYFRLIDADTGLRYIPNATVAATLAIKFKNLDSYKVINRQAGMVYPNDDRSIWSVGILSTDVLLPDSMEAVLVEGTVTHRMRLEGSLRFISAGDEEYYC